MRKPGLGGLLVAVALGASVPALKSAATQDHLTAPETVVLRERIAARVRALDVADRALSQAPVPTGWDAAAFLGTDMLNRVLGQAIGLRLRRVGGGLSGAEIELKEIRLRPTPGALEVELAAEARHGSASIGLRVAAAVSVVGFDRSGSGARVLLRMEPLELAPSAGIGSLDAAARGTWARLAPDLAILLADPSLFEFPIQIEDTFRIDFALNESGTAETGRNGRVSWRATMPGARLMERVAYSAPVFTPEGLWLLGRRSAAGQPTVLPREVGAASKPELERRAAELLERVSRPISAMGGSRAEVRAYISQSLMVALGDRLRALPSDRLLVTIQATGREGQLARQDWDHGLLGKGGTYAELRNVGAARATVQFAPPNLAWTNGALRLTLGADLRGSAPIHVHVDPNLGGGVGTEIGIQGSGSGAVTATVAPRMLSDGALRVAALTVNLACDSLRANIRTNGVIRFSEAWATVSSVGVGLGIPVGNDPLRPVALLDGTPTLVRFPALRAEGWRILPRVAGAVMALAPQEVRGDASGIHVGLNLLLEPVEADEAPDVTERRLADAEARVGTRSREIASRRDALLDRSKLPTECNRRPEVAVLIGPTEFGPNNEIVKFLQGVARFGGDAARAALRAAEDVGRAAENVGREAGRAVENVGRAFGIR